jgi:hypothetical protein
MSVLVPEVLRTVVFWRGLRGLGVIAEVDSE